MNQQGGYIWHDLRLVPIQLEQLWVWTQETSDTSQKTQSTIDDSIAKVEPNTSWRRLGSQILSADELPNYVEEESLPFLDELLFAQKPPSLLTLPGIGEDKQICLASLVNDWIPENLTVPRTQRQSCNNKKHKKKRKKQHLKPFVPRPCHRLDYDTSGVLVIGLTRDSLRLTNAMFEQKGVESGSSSNILKKTYVALVAGDVAKEHGMIDYPIGKVFNEAKGYNEFVCLQDHSEWKEPDFVDKSLRDATTLYTVLKRFTLPVPCSTSGNDLVQYTKVKLEPLTGRGHQLRLHMSAIGHPILGDQLHAPNTIVAATPRLCLHAEELEMGVRIDKERGATCMAKVKVRCIPPF
ncbi:MAG: hypothetical protein SGBAC_009620 [Bacillariaceae sp.]